MNGAAGATIGRSHTRPEPIALLVLAAMVASVLWWNAAGRIVAPGGPGGGPRPGAPDRLAVQAATGRAIVAHWEPPRDGSRPASYQVHVVIAGSRQVVARTQSWSLSASVGGLQVGVPYRVVVTAGAAGTTATTSLPVTVLDDRLPDPPATVAVTQMAGANGLSVGWTPAPTGVAASGAIVQLYDATTYTGYLTCRACTTAAFRGLPYGRRYTVKVVPINAVGPGASTASNPVDLANPCPDAAACVTIDATAAIGAAIHRAQGFLNSLYPGAMLDQVRALAPYSWRGAPAYQRDKATLDWSSWEAAVSTGARTTLVLSNLWQSETNTGTGAKTPWSDWDGYRRWVTATVRAIAASGHRVSYWEIQNEPAGAGYYGPADLAASTPAQYLEQFRVAYEAIKAAVPTAAVIGPSLSHFADYPAQYDPHEIDLVTFLDFAASHGLRLAAITWHEIDDTLGDKPRDFNNQPQAVEDHVAEVRHLVAERPALANPEVWVNEYGRRVDYAVPGWTLGAIAALEAAKVDRAGRSCWAEPDGTGGLVDDCTAANLDGLLQTDGLTVTPRANLWVYATYARMTGDLVATASSDVAVSVLAGRNANGDVVAMVGRHVSCLPGANPRCAQPATALPGPAALAVAARLPGVQATKAMVTILRVSPSWGPVLLPASVFGGPVAVVAGHVALPLPAMADGEVDVITIHP